MSRDLHISVTIRKCLSRIVQIVVDIDIYIARISTFGLIEHGHIR